MSNIKTYIHFRSFLLFRQHFLHMNVCIKTYSLFITHYLLITHRIDLFVNTHISEEFNFHLCFCSWLVIFFFTYCMRDVCLLLLHYFIYTTTLIASMLDVCLLLFIALQFSAHKTQAKNWTRKPTSHCKTRELLVQTHKNKKGSSTDTLTNGISGLYETPLLYLQISW